MRFPLIKPGAWVGNAQVPTFDYRYMAFQIYTDGGSNLKFGKAQAAGSAVLFRDSFPIFGVTRMLPGATNNQAELHGLLLAFQMIMPTERLHACLACGDTVCGTICPYFADPSGPKKSWLKPLWDEKVEIFSDSSYAVNGLNKWVNTWSGNGWKTASGGGVLNQGLWHSLLKSSVIHDYDLKLVKGHSGIHGNELADTLATATMQVMEYYSPENKIVLLGVREITDTALEANKAKQIIRAIGWIKSQIIEGKTLV